MLLLRRSTMVLKPEDVYKGRTLDEVFESVGKKNLGTYSDKTLICLK